MITARKINGSRQEEGAVLVEAAFSMLAFLLLIFGIAEGGRLLQVQNVLTNAAREGARFGVTRPANGAGEPPSKTDIRSRANAFLTSGAISVPLDNIKVSPPDPGAIPNYTIVTITYDYASVTGLFPSVAITLTGKSMMRNETSP
jgi:Flp pilus assembly protein TadG